MAYLRCEEMAQVLEAHPEFKEKLFARGFLITNERQKDLAHYPFYGNWSENRLDEVYYIYAHKDTNVYTYNGGEIKMFLIGHAYDPYHMIISETEILKRLCGALSCSTEAFWEEESCLTGVFCIGYIKNKSVVYTTDCTGMQLIYHGIIKNRLYVTSHSKLVADIENLEQTKYIKRLISTKYWHYWGTFLPGDISPFEELKRVNPNFACTYCSSHNKIEIHRFYPTKKLQLIVSEEEYKKVINRCSEIMANNMSCIAQKWPDKKVSISVTGGRDSLTTLSCAKGNYDKFSYFSYISNYDESVDAYAARNLLNYLGLKHELYDIPTKWENREELEAFKKVLECNNGCIGSNNANDVRKRLYFTKHPPCDIEVKSWVDEIGRGGYYSRYNKKKFPKRPYASYWRAMHKPYFSVYLIKETDKIFKDYLKTYYSEDIFNKFPWVELNYWEFSWSSGEGNFLTSEHRVPYEITIPFNNRKYLELMLSVPAEKRKTDAIPIDITARMEPRISESGIHVHDVSHTNFRALLIRTYLEVFSKIRFG